MPTRKQRRRQQKERRHEYEFVYVDEEGQEVEVDPAELKAERESKQTAKASGGRGQRAARPRRTVQPPSLRRVLTRGLLFAPVMYLTLSLIGGGQELTVAGRLLQTAMLLAFFLPFSYVMDKIAYRAYQRRLAKPADDANG
ncbi:MAG: hypothetical protein M3540_07145 [Actinomycetota bacterium]|nr:hypothetical protein [Actinomycetota bacterium]